MKILFLGDIFGRPGREAVKAVLPKLREEETVDFCIANVENIHHGKGVSKNKLDEMKKAGVDFFTSGNHIWKNEEIFEYMNSQESLLIRPLNYSEEAPGKGWKILETDKGKKILIINASGRIYMPGHHSDPFRAIEKILIENGILKKSIAANEIMNDGNSINGIKAAGFDCVFIDFHAETSSEKSALAYFLAGKVSAVIGTHTHTQTADERLIENRNFEGKTAFLTDVGMNGPTESIIGLRPDEIIENFLTQMPVKHEVAEGAKIFQGVLIEVSDETGYALGVTRIQKQLS